VTKRALRPSAHRMPDRRSHDGSGSGNLAGPRSPKEPLEIRNLCHDLDVSNVDRGTRRARIREAARAWRHLPRRTRIAVISCARKGERHPDARVAQIAEAWAQAKESAVAWLPGPSFGMAIVGAFFIAAAILMMSPAMAVLGFAVLVLGLLSWNSRRLAALILRCPPAPPPNDSRAGPTAT